ncbi:MAG: cation:dicarboxylase symporter family transporter [Clostridia bacterium]|nr:cation:dicarboxylase symporter family transporter [Clostridia bacterium]
MKEIKIRTQVEDFEKAANFIEKELQRNRISKQIISENIMVFEALFNDVIRREISIEDEITIQIKHSFGNPSINMGFAGDRYVPLGGNTVEDEVEYKIIKAYEDKLEYDFHASYNTIHLNVKRAYGKQTFLCVAGFVGAIIAYLFLSNTLDPAKSTVLRKNWILPVESLFTNAMLMIGAPMTFFSILKNLLETRVFSKKSSHAARLQSRTIETSTMVVAVAVAIGFAIKRFLPFVKDVFGYYELSIHTKKDLPTLISSLIPSNVFDPFRVFSPFPLIILSVMIIVAMRSVGNQFDKLKSFIDACYALFSRILNLVMFFLPAFCFLAFLDIMLDKGFASLKGVALCWCTVIFGTVIVFGIYSVSLKINKIKVMNFIRLVFPILKENVKINSAIDAAPYNIRQIGRKFGIGRNHLEDTIPVLAQINLDGNCLVIMEIAMLLIISNGAALSWWNYVALAVLVLFLSFGAPNQPGSILIGMLIVFNHLGINGMIPVAIYCEVFLGSVQNLVNVTGDVVMAVSEYRKEG